MGNVGVQQCKGDSRCCDADEETPMVSVQIHNVIEEMDGPLLRGDAQVTDRPDDADAVSRNDDKIGDHYCPLVGEEATEKFMSENKLQKLIDASQEDLGKNFSLEKNSLDATKNGSGGIAMAVSDPTAEDCPLVYVSCGFEDLTGYTTETVVGRSCRFLQPTSKIMNDAVNLGERKAMRHFCNFDQPPGEAIINLLLNERITGERFWNLLRMQYVMIDGEKYIFGVQTTLHAFMPKLLTKKVLTANRNEAIVSAIQPFLHALENLRAEIRLKTDTPIQELKGYFSCAMNMLQTIDVVPKAISPSNKTARTESKKSNDEERKPSSQAYDVTQIKAGSIVKAKQTIAYPSYQVPMNMEGKVVAVDGLGNASIEWKDIGRKNVLRRDFDKIEITANVVVEEAHPTWARLDDMLKDPSGADMAIGVASAHSRQAREEIARKLIRNHKAVIADVTNPSPKLNIEGKPLTQTELKRVDSNSKPYVDQMLREVARRLMGRRFCIHELEEMPDPTNAEQEAAWRDCAAYLGQRTQSKPEQKPGRKPDMSEEAASAFLAVLSEVANDATNPTWARLDHMLKDPRGADMARGAASAHSQQARDEAARTLIRNHTAIIADVTNPSQKLNIEGKPLTQTELKRVDASSTPYVDQMLREVARRLMGLRSGIQQLEEKPDSTNVAQGAAWRGCAVYLGQRTQSKTEQKPGRTPDMSEEAFSAFIVVLNEVANETKA